MFHLGKTLPTCRPPPPRPSCPPTFSTTLVLGKMSQKKNFFWALPKLPLPHPTARNLDKFYSYVFAPKIESVKINLGKAVPLQHTIWATFSLFKMCQNLGEAQKQGCFFWEVFPVRPDWAGGIFVNNEEKIILIRPKHFSGTRCVFSKQFEADNGGVFEMLDI